MPGDPSRLPICIAVLALGLVAAGPASGQNDRGAGRTLPCDRLDYAGFDTPPAVIDSVRAEYPEIALRADLEGTVGIEVRLDAGGEICRATIVDPVHPLLDQRAFEAAAKCRYAPATRDGEPVPGVLIVEFVFDKAQELLRLEREYENRHRWAGPLVGDLVEAESRRGHGRWRHGVYRFRGVEVHGDLSVSAFETVIDFVTRRSVDPESPTRIMNYLALAPSDRPDRATHGDIEVHTDIGDEPGRPSGRRGVYRFLVEGRSLVFAGSRRWTRDDPPPDLPWRFEKY